MQKYLTIPPLTDKEIDRFWSHVNIPGDDSCWTWMLSTSGGYGHMVLRNRKYRPSRVSYMIAYGRMDEAMVVRHTCDNPACVKPAHLVVGSQRQNMSDMVVRGRSATGEGHSQARLTEDTVREVRSLYVYGDRERSIAALARRYGVSNMTIYKVVKGLTWKHVR